MRRPKLWMVLPAYNEAPNLGSLLAGLEAAFADAALAGHERAYVIVDDGSTDATPAIVRDAAARLPVTVVTHATNQGLGPTVRDGLRRAVDLAGDDDVVLSMDADDTHPPELLAPMVRLLAEGNDVVIASRYRRGARVVGLSRVREALSWGARVLFQVVFPIRGVRDYTCAYRAYRVTLLRSAFARWGDAFVEYRGFHCMADILLKLSRLGARMAEVPLVLRYDRKGGASKMRIAATVLQTLRLLARRRIQCWTGRL